MVVLQYCNDFQIFGAAKVCVIHHEPKQARLHGDDEPATHKSNYALFEREEEREREREREREGSHGNRCFLLSRKHP